MFFCCCCQFLLLLGCILLPKQVLEGGVTALRAAGGCGSVPAVNPFFGNRPLCHWLVRGLPNAQCERILMKGNINQHQPWWYGLAPARCHFLCRQKSTALCVSRSSPSKKGSSNNLLPQFHCSVPAQLSPCVPRIVLYFLGVCVFLLSSLCLMKTPTSFPLLQNFIWKA